MENYLQIYAAFNQRHEEMCCFFPHKRIHKTWVTSDHKTKHQINHLCINKKFRLSLHGANVLRGADVNSNHHLLIMKFTVETQEKHILQT